MARCPETTSYPGVNIDALALSASPFPLGSVWPWLVQVGFGKAGFYSNDLLDNIGHPSADHIVEALQHPEVGDWVPMFKKATTRPLFGSP